MMTYNSYTNFDPKLLMQRSEETMLDYWLSFFPVAPFFGVDWRFADMTFDFSSVSGPLEPVKAIVEDAEVIEEIAPVTEAEVVVADTAADVETVVEDTVEEVAEAAELDGATPAGLFAEAPAEVDDLKLIKGVGPKLQKQLNEVGIYQFAQIAGFGVDDLDWLDEAIPTLRGRAARDNWPGQASKLK